MLEKVVFQYLSRLPFGVCVTSVSKYEAGKVVKSFNQSINQTNQPNANIPNIQNQFGDKLTQIQQELEISRQRQMSLSIGR